MDLLIWLSKIKQISLLKRKKSKPQVASPWISNSSHCLCCLTGFFSLHPPVFFFSTPWDAHRHAVFSTTHTHVHSSLPLSSSSLPPPTWYHSQPSTLVLSHLVANKVMCKLCCFKYRAFLRFTAWGGGGGGGVGVGGVDVWKDERRASHSV